MKKILLIITSLLITAAAQADSTTTQKVELKQISGEHYGAGEIDLTFQLIDKSTGLQLGENELIESHTKKLHFITYDAALKEFNHVHPTFENGVWTAKLNLPVDGNYFFWAQGTQLDKSEFSSLSHGMIMGGAKENPVLPLGDVRIGVDKNTKVTLAKSKLKAGKMAMVNFTISRTDGKKPQLSPYLGAFAHVIATPTSGDEMIHVHPMEGKKPATGMLHATFPKEGTYRLWIQLIDQGELKTIPLSVTVSK